MNKGRTILFIGALAMLAALWSARAQGAEAFSYRFLWPADATRPGDDLKELEAVDEGVSRMDTPVGAAEAKKYSLRLPGGEVVAEARVITLDGRDDALIFQTELKNEIAAPTGVYGKPHFALPAIRPDRRYDNVLDFKVEEFVTPVRYAVPTTGPVVAFSRDLDAVIVSPLDNFMGAMQAPVKGEWLCGFGGLVEDVPAGTVAQTLVVTGHGINDTFMKWGALIRKWHGRKQTGPYADVALSRLGYWTDNGSYYYYRTEPGMNYHETLLAVKAYADKERIPYGYFQIDSWWYPKAEIDDRSSHNRGGFLLWEPNPEMFPAGLAVFDKDLGLPLVAHNRYCASESPYCKKYKCAYGTDDKKRGALPIDPAFWDEIMNNAVSYGVKVYEQDWLYTHESMIPWLRKGLHNGELWYDAMAGAAEKRGLTMQLCMASPEFFMQQLKHNNATHARTSHDYKGGLPKAFFWAPFHKASLFAWAVGMWPFKDNFQSTAGQRPTYNIMPEANPEEEAMVAALSGGPVGPSDRIGYSDRALIMRTCREDGILLKPDRPATPIDIMFLYNKNILLGSKKPWVVTTESEHELGRTVYLAAFNLWPQSMREPRVSFDEAGISGSHLVYNYRTGDFKIASDRISFGWMKPEEGFYYVLCPVLENGMAVVGEVNKFITMSAKRFHKAALEDGDLHLSLEGVPGEELTLAVYSVKPITDVEGTNFTGPQRQGGQGLLRIQVVIPESGTAEVVVR